MRGSALAWIIGTRVWYPPHLKLNCSPEPGAEVMPHCDCSTAGHMVQELTPIPLSPQWPCENPQHAACQLMGKGTIRAETYQTEQLICETILEEVMAADSLKN